MKTVGRRRWAGPHKSFTLITEADARPYQTRWWLFDTPWLGLALHKFTSPDTSRTLHDHPFAFVSLVLRGGYTEDRRNLRSGLVNSHRVKRWNMMRRVDAHCITKLHSPSVWTLMICGADCRIWGFWLPTEDRRRWLWIRNDLHQNHGQRVA